MARVLDTALLPAGERVDAVDAAVRHARLPALLRPETEAADFGAEVDVWASGGGTEFLRWSGSAYRISRGRRQINDSSEHRVAITMIGPGPWSWRHQVADRVVDSRDWDILLVDHGSAYEFVQAGVGTTYAFNIDFHDLGFPVDQLRRAGATLRSSPLYDLVIQHMISTCRSLDDVPGPSTTLIGSATADLMRALISTAGSESGRPPRDESSLLVQTKLYVDRHLTEHGLSPQRIARAHAVSLRTLYQAWASNDPSLAEYVMAGRLELAHRLLSRPSHRPMTIAEIARRSGFVDMAHFSRRFRRAYLMSPRDWRQLCVKAEPPG